MVTYVPKCGDLVWWGCSGETSALLVHLAGEVVAVGADYCRVRLQGSRRFLECPAEELRPREEWRK